MAEKAGSVLGSDVKQRLTDREYRDKLKDAHDIFEMFKREAYKAHEI